jgi:hypothetical protein
MSSSTESTNVLTGWRRPDRPWQLSAIGYVGMAIGYIGFLLKGVTLVMQFVPVDVIRKNLNPDFNRDVTEGEFTVSVISLAIGMVLSLLSLAGGIGLLKMRRWGRKTMRVYAVGAIIMTLLLAGWSFSNFDRRFQQQVSAGRLEDGVDLQQERNLAMLRQVINPPALLIWPLAIITILGRRPIVEAIERAERGQGRFKTRPVDLESRSNPEQA